jgi:hypothetical protein
MAVLAGRDEHLVVLPAVDMVQHETRKKLTSRQVSDWL